MSPLASSTAAASCLCSAAGARRHKSASTGWGSTRRKTTVRATGSSVRTHRDYSPSGRHGDTCCFAEASSGQGGRRNPVSAAFLRSTRCIRRRRCPVWAPIPPTCTPRPRLASTGGPRPVIRDAGATTASPGTITTTGTRRSASSRSITRLIQHFPVLRETWVFSFRALARTTIDKGGQVMPFFMLPSLGGSSTLRGYTSLRFRDRNSLLLQGEWRIMASRFLDSAVFYDAGKVTARTIRPRLRRAEARLRLRPSFSRPDLNAAPHRAGQG